jgi:hypothetical protein
VQTLRIEKVTSLLEGWSPFSKRILLVQKSNRQNAKAKETR